MIGNVVSDVHYHICGIEHVIDDEEDMEVMKFEFAHLHICR